MEPEELPDGRLVCPAHKLTICGKCCVDYSFMDDVLGEEQEESDGDEEMTEEEMAAFRARMIAKKGCACFLPLPGSGCYNCDWELKEKMKTQGEMDKCASCGKTYALDDHGKGKKLNKCARCLQAMYCSRECQKADWKAGHQKICNKAEDKDGTASKA